MTRHIGRFHGSIMIALLTVLAPGAGPLVSQKKAHPCKEPLPKGIKARDEISYSGPWVYEEIPAHGVKPISGIDNSHGRPRNGPIKVRLDDDSFGTLFVEQKQCGPGDNCSPEDCGCFAWDSYWIHVKDAEGKAEADFHLWSAYGYFQIVPVDLVDGPSDELLIFWKPNRGSSLFTYGLKIWKLGKKKPIDLGSVESVLGWQQQWCSVWRDRVHVEKSAKPRNLILRRDIAAEPCCVSAQEARDVGRRRILRFSAKNGKYEEKDLRQRLTNACTRRAQRARCRVTRWPLSPSAK